MGVFKPEGRKYFTIEFRFNGKRIQKRTRATSRKDAKVIEARIKSELARGNFGILEPEPAPTLAEFLKRDFLPYTLSKFAEGSSTRDYYSYGSDMLTKSDLASLPLSEITDQHARGFEARYAHLEKSTINCGLRTLRRALSLAEQWSKLDRRPKIALAKGENKRTRVLTEDEGRAYLAASPQPWRDVATIILGTGARPDEVFRLRWEQIEWRDGGGIIHILRGKTDAAMRPLPMLPEVFQALAARHEAQGFPADGWAFPSESASGHLMQGSAKNYHARALKGSGVISFAPYVLRHTGLTRIAPHCDAYTLAKIAGHTSITMTMRYIHPQQNAIEQTFSKMAGRQKVPTKAPYQEKLQDSGKVDATEVTAKQSVA